MIPIRVPVGGGEPCCRGGVADRRVTKGCVLTGLNGLSTTSGLERSHHIRRFRQNMSSNDRIQPTGAGAFSIEAVYSTASTRLFGAAIPEKQLARLAIPGR
jgi:hypothetical protein